MVLDALRSTEWTDDQVRARTRRAAPAGAGAGGGVGALLGYCYVALTE
ncbi:hypothetical protein [Halobacterium rubrum]|nr:MULTISPECIES: hypothetical protein [Halobacterium]MDH5019610.1 hypothetical protein [Halobacterium rubrum]